MSAPRIDAEASFLPDTFDIVLVEDFERESKAGFQFILPLQQH